MAVENETTPDDDNAINDVINPDDIPYSGDVEQVDDVVDDVANDNGDVVITYDGQSLNDDADVNDDVHGDVSKLKKENERLAKELEAVKNVSQVVKKEPELNLIAPVKPLLSDYDYDESLFNTALDEYLDKQIEYKSALAKHEAKQNALNQTLLTKKEKYLANREKVINSISDYKNVEDIVVANLPIAKQNFILMHAENPELLVYTLGKNKDLLKDFINTEDMGELGYKMAKIESKTAKTNKKPLVKPESRVSGGSGSVSSNNKQLQSLLEKAQKTRDFTQYIKASKAK